MSAFPGLSHAEALEREVEPTRQLIENLIEAGTVGTVAALPGTHKSFLASEVAFKIAAGGSVLGAKVLVTGPVGYWWQDDSEQNELARLQTYAKRHGFTSDLPITWHLNEDLDLRKNLGVLRAEIEAKGQVLSVVDSFYNFTGGLILKEEQAAEILKRLKSEVCDPTGCAVLVVDHAPWPTEGNRGQRRAYGSVFKAAAIRWGVYLERDGSTLYIEARGNNLRGFDRTPAIWDENTLELRLVDVKEIGKRDLAEEVAEYLDEHYGARTDDVIAGVHARADAVRKVLNDDPRFGRVDPPPGVHPNSKCWAIQEIPVPLSGTERDGTRQVHTELVPSDSLLEPRRGSRDRDGTNEEPVPKESDGNVVPLAVPLIGDPDFLPALRLRREHLTDKEWQQRRALHKLVELSQARRAA
jgi:AAA domain-containing protein